MKNQASFVPNPSNPHRPSFASSASATAGSLRAPIALAFAIAIGTVQVSHADFKRIFPDTLAPGILHQLPVVNSLDRPVLPSGLYTDTVLLKGGGLSHILIYRVPTSGDPVYTLDLPCQAKPGPYDIYDRAGKLVESNVTHVSDVAGLTPSIEKTTNPKGLRGANFQVLFSGSGLPFGPLPATGKFQPNLVSSKLERGSRNFPITLMAGNNPYAQVFIINIPTDADTGAYELTVERADGIRTTMTGAIRVWVPPKPVITQVVPDSLNVGTEGAIGLVGTDMQFGIRQGSFVNLDREIVKEIFLRKDETILKPMDYPNFGFNGIPFSSPVARFAAPAEIHKGIYDVGLVLNGRTDTSFLMQGVRILGPGTPALVSLMPAKMGRAGVLATVNGAFLTIDLGQAKFSLQRGTIVYEGTVNYGSSKYASVYFSVPAGADTGFYDVVAEKGALRYQIKAGMHLLDPQITAVTPPGLYAGGEADFEFAVDYLGMGWSIELEPDSLGIMQYAPDLKSVRLCRGTDCLSGNLQGFGNFGVKVTTVIPASQTPGLYDLVAERISDGGLLKKPDALLIAPSGLLPVTPALIGMAGAFFALEAGTDFTFTVSNDLSCGRSGYALPLTAPAGMELKQGILTWTPAAADVGIRYLNLVPKTVECKVGLYLALRVSPKSVIAIAPSAKRWNNRSTAEVWRAGAGRIGIRLDGTSAVEIRSTQGRLLRDFGEFAAGRHTLTLPNESASQGLLLCRVRNAEGNTWLRVSP